MNKKKVTPAKKTKHSAKEMSSISISNLIAKLNTEMNEFILQEDVDTTLTGRDRQRLFSSGVRNNGFIDKAFDIANDNQSFMPSHFNLQLVLAEWRRFEQLRQLMLVLQQFNQVATNAFMMQSDICYHDALRIYGNLRELTRSKIPGAQELFNSLRTYFHRRKRLRDEVSEHELERDFKRLVHGKADGKIVIENETPKVIKGVHKVVDDVVSGKNVVKVGVNKDEEI